MTKKEIIKNVKENGGGNIYFCSNCGKYYFKDINDEFTRIPLSVAMSIDTDMLTNRYINRFVSNCGSCVQTPIQRYHEKTPKIEFRLKIKEYEAAIKKYGDKKTITARVKELFLDDLGKSDENKK